MSQYKHDYDSLQDNVAEFRLVTILPGVLPNPILSSLATHRIHDHPPYEALSYVWGPFDKEEPELILLGEYAFAVTTNLSRALYCLRREKIARTLWIDAICINQDNLDERSSQVQLMRDIYKASERTVVWLGEESFYSGRTFELLKSVSTQRVWNSDYENQAILGRRGQLRHKLETDDQVRKIVQRGVYGDIAQRDFWTRIWIVQEVTLSSQVTIQCGSDEIDWKEFSETIWTIDQASNDAMAIPEDELDIGGLSNIETLNILRELLGHGAILQLSDILALLRRSRSTDPRDMVYGLLGLIPNGSIQPNYSHATVQDVYSSLVHQCITKEKSLNIITLCRNSSTNTQHPSWVPDWTESWVLGYGDDYKVMQNPDPPPFPLILKYGTGELLKNFTTVRNTEAVFGPEGAPLKFTAWSADGSNAPRASVQQSPLTLTARGILIGAISSLGDFTYRGDDDGEIFFFDILSNWEEMILQNYGNSRDNRSGKTVIDVLDQSLKIMINQIRSSNLDIAQEMEGKFKTRLTQKIERQKYHQNDALYVGGGNVVEAFVRTITADTDAYFQRITPAKFDAFWNTDGTGSSAWAMEIYALTFATNRRLFITDNGYIGLAPIRARIGDQVYVLYGCSVPVVLRKQDGCVRLMGEAYCHGLMDGRAIAMVEDGSWKDEQCVIR